MKTNVNMVRPMGNFEVVQRTKDGMFNATSLLKQWNASSGSKKEVKEFLRNDSTQKFIYELRKDNGDNSPYLSSRGKNGGTWMNPYLFIDFAMWLNPSFKLQVIKFVYDELIKHRHDAGDNYRTFCKSISKISKKCNFSEPAQWLNYVVFNNHQKSIRNNATDEQLNDLCHLEKKYADLINEGYLTSIETLKYKLRKEWQRRHSHMPTIFK